MNGKISASAPKGHCTQKSPQTTVTAPLLCSTDGCQSANLLEALGMSLPLPATVSNISNAGPVPVELPSLEDPLKSCCEGDVQLEKGIVAPAVSTQEPPVEREGATSVCLKPRRSCSGNRRGGNTQRSRSRGNRSRKARRHSSNSQSRRRKSCPISSSRHFCRITTVCGVVFTLVSKTHPVPIIAITDARAQVVTDSAYYLQEVVSSSMKADALIETEIDNDIFKQASELDFVVSENVWIVHSKDYPVVKGVGVGGVKGMASEGKMYKWSVYLALAVALGLALGPTQNDVLENGDFALLLNEARSVCNQTLGDVQPFLNDAAETRLSKHTNEVHHGPGPAQEQFDMKNEALDSCSIMTQENASEKSGFHPESVNDDRVQLRSAVQSSPVEKSRSMSPESAAKQQARFKRELWEKMREEFEDELEKETQIERHRSALRAQETHFAGEEGVATIRSELDGALKTIDHQIKEIFEVRTAQETEQQSQVRRDEESQEELKSINSVTAGLEVHYMEHNLEYHRLETTQEGLRNVYQNMEERGRSEIMLLRTKLQEEEEWQADRVTELELRTAFEEGHLQCAHERFAEERVKRVMENEKWSDGFAAKRRDGEEFNAELESNFENVASELLALQAEQRVAARDSQAKVGLDETQTLTSLELELIATREELNASVERFDAEAIGIIWLRADLDAQMKAARYELEHEKVLRDYAVEETKMLQNKLCAAQNDERLSQAMCEMKALQADLDSGNEVPAARWLQAHLSIPQAELDAFQGDHADKEEVVMLRAKLLSEADSLKASIAKSASQREHNQHLWQQLRRKVNSDRKAFAARPPPHLRNTVNIGALQGEVATLRSEISIMGDLMDEHASELNADIEAAECSFEDGMQRVTAALKVQGQAQTEINNMNDNGDALASTKSCWQEVGTEPESVSRELAEPWMQEVEAFHDLMNIATGGNTVKLADRIQSIVEEMADAVWSCVVSAPEVDHPVQVDEGLFVCREEAITRANLQVTSVISLCKQPPKFDCANVICWQVGRGRDMDITEFATMLHTLSERNKSSSQGAVLVSSYNAINWAPGCAVGHMMLMQASVNKGCKNPVTLLRNAWTRVAVALGSCVLTNACLVAQLLLWALANFDPHEAKLSPVWTEVVHRYLIGETNSQSTWQPACFERIARRRLT